MKKFLCCLFAFVLIGNAAYAQVGSGVGSEAVGFWTSTDDTTIAPFTGYTTINVAEICDENDSNCLDISGGVGGISNVVEDTTPQLGGALDAQGNDINNGGVIFLTEQADAEADVAGKGQIWVNTATPNELYFTDDAGNDRVIAYDGGDFDTTGNAATSTALAANGTNCSAGNSPLGVDAGGASESCFDVWTEAENTAAAYIDATVTALASLTSIQGHTVTLTGNLIRVGAHALTLTTTGVTDVTFPTTGTLVNTAVTALNSLGTVSTALTGVLRADSGVLSADTDVTDLVTAATSSAQGKVELAIGSEVTTGTDTDRAITPDALAGSDFGKKRFGISLFESDAAVTTGDGKVGIPIDSTLNGFNVVNFQCNVYTKGVTGTTDVVLRRQRGATDTNVTSTAVTIGDEYFAADGTIDTGNDDLATGDMLFIDVDAIHSGTAPNGLSCVGIAQLP